MTNRKRLTSLICLLILIFGVLTFTSCGGVENFEISFIVDGETYQTITTDGKSTIAIPENPIKEGYTFEGWYWDKDTWSKPFTANSLLDAPLSSDMKVYAKWCETNPACQHRDSNDDLFCDYCNEAHDDGEEIYEYTVTFEVNGGTAVAPITASVIQETPITTKDYNTFVGWYTDVNLQESTRVSFPLALTSDITLYAKWSVDFTEGLQMTLQTSTNTYFVTGYTGTESTVVIPSTYKGLDVTGINARAFEGNSMITEIVIPNSVITVGLGAFSECYNLVTVDMSDQLQLLGASAFSNCIKLESIDLPDTLQNIGGESFFGCIALEELYLSNELLNIGTNIIRGCTSLKKLTLPGRITLISLVGDTNDNIPANLTEIIFASGSESICENALYNCVQIENITIPDGVTAIHTQAFYGCDRLASIVVPDSVMTIDTLVFGRCTTLESLTLPFVGATKGGTENAHFGYIFGALNYEQNGSFVPQSLKTVTITKAQTIDDNAFYGCSHITDILLPDTLTSLGRSAFEGCEGLGGVYVSNLSLWCDIDFENEKSNPIYYAKKLYINNVLVTDLTIPNNVTEIKPYAFYNCELTSVYIPSSVQTCGFSSFCGCNTIESITLPFVGNARDAIENTYFGYIFGASDYAYNYDYVPATLRNVVITDASVIDAYAFYKCKNLTSITIPDSVLNIKECAFYLCGGIETFDISANVVNIERGAFGACTNLTDIRVSDQNTNYKVIDSVLYNKNGDILIQYPAGKIDTTFSIPNTVLTIYDYAFAACSNLISVSIPSKNMVSIGDYAFVACTKIVNMNVPSGVSTIGYGAFAGCSELESLTLPFVGNTADGASNTHFGYIFGAEAYTVNAGNVPTGLKNVVISNGTSISDFAFYGCSSIESIMVADGVASIGSGAFLGCTSLDNITLPFVGNLLYGSSNTHFGYVFGAASYNENASFVPESLHTVIITGGQRIYTYAFKGCSEIYEVVIPNSVTIIDIGAFQDCSQINKITLPFVGYTENSTGLRSHLGYIFDCTKSTTYIPHHLYLEETYSSAYYRFFIPATLRTVVVTKQKNFGEYAFKNCERLHKIILPDDTENFSGGAIEGCTYLSYNESDNGRYIGSFDNPYMILVGMIDTSATQFTIPNSTEIICDFAFQNSSLQQITVPNNVKKIGKGAFSGCTRLHNLSLPFVGESRDAEGYQSHFGYIFDYYVSTSEPSHYHYYGTEYVNGQHERRYYTYNFSTWVHVTITGDITSISYQAFRGCVQLESIVIPNSVTDVAPSAFKGCTNLYIVTMSENIISIGDSAFEGCKDFANITIPTGVTTIGNKAFYGCTDLVTVTIPSSVTSIGKEAFANCTGLTSVTFENPNGWWYTSNNTATSGTAIESNLLADAATAITTVVSDYCSYYWRRS